ncbi:MAG: cation-translocating P-type ATPase [Bacteroidota bacterium]
MDQTTHIEWQVKGMTCTHCALGIEKFLEKEGVGEIAVDFSGGEVSFTTEEPQKIPSLIKGIHRLGFEVVKEEDAGEGISPLTWFLGISAVFTFPLLLHMFISWHPLHNPWVQLGLSLPVFGIGMWYFGRSAWGSIRAGVPNMDVLITIGATAAMGYSLYGLIGGLGPDFMFFETAASIITLVLLGNWIEHRAVRQTTTSIQALTALQPQQATRILPSGEVETISIRRVEVGDQLRVLSGDKVPVDGSVLVGEGTVDESMITGESLPVEKERESYLTGGTVVLDGQMTMRAEKVGRQTTLSHIIQLVKQAQRDKPEIQQLADQISAIFVPAVFGISLLTFILSWAVFDLSVQASLIHAIAVLVISCPSAMGLATPTAVVVGIGRASRNGILIKGGRTLEQFAKVQQVVFDKTGTLTTGKFQLEKIQTADPADIPLIQQVIYSLEQHSRHPIAQSLVEALEGTAPLALTQVSEQKGLGMLGYGASGDSYQLGSFRIAAGYTDQKFDLYLIRNNEFWAGINLADTLRPEAKEAIAELKKKGIRPILLSGDKQSTCKKVASELGIEEVYAEQLPQQKLEHLQRLSQQGLTAMVGDGINDAPALAKADVGISMSGATDIAIQSAQVILLKGNLNLLPELLRISQHTVRTIKQNLFWAFFYNIVAIPFAAMGFLKPILAALAMAFSDVIVIGNSIRLRFKRLKD